MMIALVFALPHCAEAQTTPVAITINSLTVSSATVQPGKTITFSAVLTANQTVSNYPIEFSWVAPGASSGTNAVLFVSYKANQSITETASWTVPVNAATGQYILYLSAYNPAWSVPALAATITNFVIDSGAVPQPMSVSVTSLTTTPSVVHPGQAVSVTANFTATQSASNLPIDFSLFAPGGREVADAKIYTNYVAGQSVTKSGSWTIPDGGPTGAYKVVVNAYDSKWDRPALGNGTASFSVSAATPDSEPGPSAALFSTPYYTCSTNQYVSQTGSDSSGTGTSGNPWLTLVHANAQKPTAGTCINVAPSTTAYSGLTITAGGSSAKSTGYVVYRCQTLDGCIVTGNAGVHGAGAFEMQWTSQGTPPNYVIVDGFTLQGNGNAATNANGVGFSAWNGTNDTAVSSHHIWLLNSIVEGFGQSGVGIAGGEYYYIIHNTIYGNSNIQCSAEGSGIAVNIMNPVASYTPTSDDLQNTAFNPTWTYATGTGNFFHNAVMWNNVYTNALTQCGTPSHAYDTDGNGIIFDSNSGNRSPDVPYTPESLVAFNVVYNNGGGGVHVFYSQNITVANNTCYNNELDTGNAGTGRACIDESEGQNVTFLNNIAVAIPVGGNTSCFNNQPPYTRYNFAMLGSPRSGGTADTWNNNISQIIGSGCSSEYNMYGNDAGTYICTTSRGTNLCATAPDWVSVGNVGTGSDTVPPNGANFALQSGSPAIGFGATKSYLPSTSVDVGACSHTLTQCP